MANVFSAYSDLLARPGARAFASAGLLSRMPIAMYNIGMILMVQIQYDSYEAAGRVAAVGVAAWALQTVPTARLTDRIGQSAVMWPLTGLHVLGVTAAILVAMTRGPEQFLWVATALASLSGPLGSLTRARWSHILDSDDDIHRAFSLEGALDEVLFITGPALVTVLATTVWAPLGLILSTVGMVVGISILLAQRSTEPPSRRLAGGAGLGWKLPPAVIAVTIVATALGALFGSFDISTVAFAEASGLKSWSGAVLGAVAFGSFMGGLWYGSRSWRTTLWKRLVTVALVMSTGFAVVGLMPNLVLYAAVGFIAGLAIAPTLAGLDNVVQRVVSRSQLTEGMAWLRIGVGAGVAFGAWFGGVVIESSGARAGLYVMMCSAAAIAVTTVATIPWLRRGTAEREGPVEAAPLPLS